MEKCILRLQVEDTASRYGGVAANVLNKQTWTASKGWFYSLGLGKGLTTHSKKPAYYFLLHGASESERLGNGGSLLWTQ